MLVHTQRQREGAVRVVGINSSEGHEHAAFLIVCGNTCHHVWASSVHSVEMEWRTRRLDTLQLQAKALVEHDATGELVQLELVLPLLLVGGCTRATYTASNPTQGM